MKGIQSILILIISILTFNQNLVGQNSNADFLDYFTKQFEKLERDNALLRIKSDSAALQQVYMQREQLELQKRQQQQTQIYVTFALMAGLVIATLFFMFWKRNEDMKRKIELEKLKKEELTDQDLQEQGGFIFIEMGENEKKLFHDLLKGFEEYAQLKGYSISFSIDSSLPNKVGFKFTILDTGVTVSPNKVRKDIQEYILKVKNDKPLDDLPIVITPEEHSLILTVMKNRISFLKHNFELEKNAKEYYLGFIRQLSQASPIHHQPSIFVQTGGNNIPQLNSGNSLMNSNNLNNSTNYKIKISNSFNKRKEQIEKIDEIKKLIRGEEQLKEDIKEEVIRNLLNIKEELEENEEPDKSRIEKGLEKTKTAMSTMVLSHKTAKALQWLYESFELIGNTFSGIG